MLRLLSFAMLLVVSCCVRAQDLPAQPENSKEIFNGKDLAGWDGDPRLWSVRDGVIHGETTEENKADGNTFLIWQGGRTGNFDLRLSFRCNATNNSGIQYRSKHITEGNPRNKWVVRGYQHELRNELDFPNVSGFIYDEEYDRAIESNEALVKDTYIKLEGKRHRVVVLGNTILCYDKFSFFIR